MKIAASAAMRENIPTRPREGSSQERSGLAMANGVPLIALSSLLVSPVRILRMFEVPKRPAASDRGNQCEIIGGRRRSSGPLERPGIPRVAPCTLALEVRPQQVANEGQNTNGLKDHSYGRQEIPQVPTAPGLVGID